MRSALSPAAVVLLLAGSLAAQDRENPGRTASDDQSFSFKFHQGWILRAPSETDLVGTTRAELTRDIAPLLLRTDPQTGATVPVEPRRTDSDTRWAPNRRTPEVLRPKGDPLDVEGRLTIRKDGVAVFSFSRIQYSDATQRWWIELKDSRIRAYHLGGKSRWTGSGDEWEDRLEVLEAAFIGGYLKVVTPVRPEPKKPGIALNVPRAADPGRRLFVASCLEEQLCALLLARLHDQAIERALWPPECAKYPPRVIALTRSILDRLVVQSAGELAPKEARQKRSRTVKDRRWDGAILAVPAFHWADGSEWASGLRKSVGQARERLTVVAEQSVLNRGILVTTWSTTVDRELGTLEQSSAVPALERAPTIKDVLAPVSVRAGRGTYDFKEKLSVKDGRLVSSKVETYGLVKDWEVAFFHSGLNRWRVSRIRFDTWYRGEVKRQ